MTHCASLPPLIKIHSPIGSPLITTISVILESAAITGAEKAIIIIKKTKTGLTFLIISGHPIKISLHIFIIAWNAPRSVG